MVTVTRYLLDTNMVSYILSGRSQSARSHLSGLSHDEIANVSAITVAELRYGLSKRVNPLRTAILERFLAGVDVVAWGVDEATVYASLRASQDARGAPLGSMDLLIATHVTRDKAFSEILSLRCINWADDL